MKKTDAGQLAQEMQGRRAGQKYYQAKEIAQAMNTSTRNIQRRAAKEGWPYIEEEGIGGTRKLFGPLSSLPPEVRRAVEAWEVGAVVSSQLPAVIEQQPVIVRNNKQQQVTLPSRDDPKTQKALARADLVAHYLRFAVENNVGGGVIGAKRDFLAAYNAGITGLFPRIFLLLGKVTFPTIERWAVKAKRAETGDPVRALTSRHGEHLRGRHALGGERREFGDFVSTAQGKILLAYALNPNKYNKAEAIRLAKAAMRVRGIAGGLADETYRRFLEDFEARFHHIWVYSREGKQAWNDSCAFFIRRDYGQLEVGDVLVADGHTFNFESLNPYTGKPKRLTLITFMDMKSNFPCGWEIMPTENTAAIAAALRRAILTLGKLPLCVYLDNGLAFGAKHFTADLQESGLGGLFARLGIETIFAWPYHGQSKTVERFHKTLKTFEKQAPTYVGGSISEKPPHRKMGEKAHRRMWVRLTGGFIPTLVQTHQALAAWLDEDYNPRPQERGHLNGQSPLEVFEAGRGPGVDPAELRQLMLSATVRTIHRRGVTWQGQEYWHPALYGRRHPALVRYDLLDPDYVLVYGQEGEFLCEARPAAMVHPIARIKGSEEDLALLEEQIRLKKAQEREASVICRTLAREVVAPETQAHFARLGLSADGALALPETGRKRPRITAQDVERVQREYEQGAEVVYLTAPAAEPEADAAAEAVDLSCRELDYLSENDRYERLLEMAAQGVEVPARFQTWMSFFEKGIIYAARREWYEDYRLRLAAFYQGEGDFNDVQQEPGN